MGPLLENAEIEEETSYPGRPDSISPSYGGKFRRDANVCFFSSKNVFIALSSNNETVKTPEYMNFFECQMFFQLSPMKKA